MLYLDMIYDEDFDIMTLPEIALIASQLALQCTVTSISNALGGVAPVGPKGVLYIEFFGTREPTFSAVGDG